MADVRANMAAVTYVSFENHAKFNGRSTSSTGLQNQYINYGKWRTTQLNLEVRPNFTLTITPRCA